MWAAANHVIASGAAVRVSMLWLVASYFLQGLGELSLSPVGLSSMTKLAPKRFSGLTMGAWFTSLALGNLIAGLVGGNVDPEKLTEMPALFQRTAFSLFIAAAILLMLVAPIRKMMERSSR
jgi:POT family proton-dependent oligopeptide transporter